MRNRNVDGLDTRILCCSGSAAVEPHYGCSEMVMCHFDLQRIYVADSSPKRFHHRFFGGPARREAFRSVASISLFSVGPNGVKEGRTTRCQ